MNVMVKHTDCSNCADNGNLTGDIHKWIVDFPDILAVRVQRWHGFNKLFTLTEPTRFLKWNGSSEAYDLRAFLVSATCI